MGHGWPTIFNGCKPLKMKESENRIFRFRVVNAHGRAFYDTLRREGANTHSKHRGLTQGLQPGPRSIQRTDHTDPMDQLFQQLVGPLQLGQRQILLGAVGDGDVARPKQYRLQAGLLKKGRFRGESHAA